jgi:hypothetical protein
MSSKQNIFDNSTANLGIEDKLYGYDIAETSSILKHSWNPSTHMCLICSNTASHKLIAKHKHLNTAQIEDKGYVCEYCLQQKYIDPTQYGIRDIRRK